MQTWKWLRGLAGLCLLACSAAAYASSDITNRDLQALRGVKAVVLLAPELGERAGAAGVTPALVARRTQVYLKDIGVSVLADDADLRPGERSEAPAMLIQFGVSDGERQRTQSYITINLLRDVTSAAGAAVVEGRPVYIVQHSGLMRQKLTRSYLMRELDLALNMLREDLRRANR